MPTPTSHLRRPKILQVPLVLRNSKTYAAMPAPKRVVVPIPSKLKYFETYY